MNDNFDIDYIDTSKKVSKFSLLKKMLSFAKPYKYLILLSLFLVLLSVVAELLNPYLVKLAIDEHISGDTIPMVQTDISDSASLKIGNKFFKRLDKSERNNLDQKDVYYIKQVDTSRYLTKDGKLLEEIDANNYRIFRKNDINSIVKISLLYLLVVLIGFVCTWISNYLIGSNGNKIMFDIREQIFNHLVKQNTKFFTNNPVGKLLTRVTSDTDTISNFYLEVLIAIIADICILAGIIVMMINLNLKLFLLCFLLLPFIFFVTIYFTNKFFRIFRVARRKRSQIFTSLNEYISGMSIINIFGKQEKISRKFDELNSSYLSTIRYQIRNQALFRPCIELIRSLGEALLIYIGGGVVLREVIPFGTLFLFITYLKKFFQPILDMTELYNMTQNVFSSLEKVTQILDLDTQTKVLDIKEKTESNKGDIEFKNVSFSYIEGEPVLKDISFSIKKGESVAFVGATGAGKTSIISLMMRLYDINSGNIFLDGKDIRTMELKELRSRIGTVLQDVFLFSGDIKYNLTLGKNYSTEEILEACKRVKADEFINKLPDGIYTKVQERGQTLSSGERQLLSFARTLLIDPEILILDEATASIDTETELWIQEGLKELMKDRTTIAIAHRLSTISSMDKIIVLNKGRIVETGNHQELLEKKGMYYKLYKLQMSEQKNKLN